MVLNIKHILGVLSVVAILLLGVSYGVNMMHIESHGRNASSYQFFTPFIWVFFGCISLLSTWFSHRIHKGLGVITFGVGVFALIYGLYIVFIKVGVL